MEDARYIDVPVASGPGTTVNTCGGCGAALTGTSHHVYDCLVVLKNKIEYLERHPMTVGPGHIHHNHPLNGTNNMYCDVCGHGPPY
jgi:hypothetical protein